MKRSELNKIAQILNQNGLKALAGTIVQSASEKDHILNQVKKYTESNHHTEAYALVSLGILKNQKLVSAFKSVQTLESYFGHLPEHLKQVRDELYENMKKQITMRLGEEYWNKISKNL